MHGQVPDGWELMFVPGPPVGPNVRTSSLGDIAEALAGLPGDLGWTDVEFRVLPLFQRVRPYPPGFPEPIVTIVPPGLPVGLGVDIGPGHVHISSAMVEGWSMTVGDVTARAMVNLHGRASTVRPDQVVWADVVDVPTGMLQTELGIGSTLVLAPDELRRILGDAPRLLIAPMRDLLVALPPDELDIALELFAEIASEDPNHLPPRVFGFDGRTVVVRAIGVGGLPQR
jgi:hypothetical protein